MRKSSISLAVRIVGLTMILLTVIFLILTLQVSKQIKEGIFKEQSQNMMQSSLKLRLMIDLKMDSLIQKVSSLGGNEALIDIYKSGDTSELKQWGKELKEDAGPLYESVLFFGPDGTILSSYPEYKGNQQDWSDRDFIQEVERGDVFISPKGFFSSISDKPVVAVSSPVVSRGEILGIMVVQIDLNVFNEEFIKPNKYGELGYAYLIDMEGTILGHPDLALLESNVYEYDFTQEMINSPDNEGIIYYEWDGLWKYAFYSKMENAPWIVATSIYENDLLSLMKKLVRNLIYISLGSLAAVGLLISFSVVIFVSRPLNGISHSISSGSESLESASYQISSSSQELSSFSSQLASSVEEISSSIEELQSVVELNTKNINQSELMMKETNDGAQEVTREMGELKNSLVEINDNSKQIVKIIKVIEDIAFQTNILALNAAVEAARAGDAGRGFAVVADQVKDLAQKSAGAASETAVLIDKAIDSVARGEELGERVLEVQLKAGNMSQKVATLLDEVNRSSQEQMRGINQITQAISQTNSGVQQSAASAEETAAASEELLSQAEELNALVDRLNLLVKGRVTRQDNSGQHSQGNSASTWQHERSSEHQGGAKKSAPRVILPAQGQSNRVDVSSAEDRIPFDEDEEEFKDF